MYMCKFDGQSCTLSTCQKVYEQCQKSRTGLVKLYNFGGVIEK